MPVTIPPILVLFVCKVVIAGPPDINAGFTGAENLEWATENSMMQCRRLEIPVFDSVAGMKLNPDDDPAPELQPNLANKEQCARIGVQIGYQWDIANKSRPWRVWRVGCPVPIVDTRTGAMIGYKLPECPHRETTVCEVDSAI